MATASRENCVLQKRFMVLYPKDSKGFPFSTLLWSLPHQEYEVKPLLRNMAGAIQHPTCASAYKENTLQGFLQGFCFPTLGLKPLYRFSLPCIFEKGKTMSTMAWWLLNRPNSVLWAWYHLRAYQNQSREKKQLAEFRKTIQKGTFNWNRPSCSSPQQSWTSVDRPHPFFLPLQQEGSFLLY